jgi:hypothetical protein
MNQPTVTVVPDPLGKTVEHPRYKALHYVCYDAEFYE